MPLAEAWLIDAVDQRITLPVVPDQSQRRIQAWSSDAVSSTMHSDVVYRPMLVDPVHQIWGKR